MKKVIIAIAIVLVLGGIIGSCGLIKGRGKNSAGNGQKIEVVRRGDFQMRIRATGNLEPLVDVEVKSNVEGEIVRLYVDEGDYVEQGQVLLDLDPEQVQEDKKQADANVAAAEAQLRQAELRIHLKEEELQSALRQAMDNVEIAKSNLKTVQAATRTQITQAETQIQTTQNDLAEDKIALEQAKIALKQAKLRLAELEAERDSAKVSLDTAESELKRNRELFEKKLVSKKSLEDAESRHASAQSQYNSIVKRLESQQQTVDSQEKTINTRKSAIKSREATLAYQELNREQLGEMRKAEEEESKLQLQIAQTRLDQIRRTLDNEKTVIEQARVSAEANLLRNKSSLKNEEERLDWTTIKAPMAGTVTLLEVEEGEIVTSGRSAFSQSPPLMTIADLSKMVVKTYINEVDMERLRLNQKAEIKADAYRDKIYEGRVAEVSPSGQERDNIISFEVMVEVVGSPPELRPGMSADVDIITYEEQNVLLLPIDAIQEKKTVTAMAQIDDTSGLKEKQEVQLQALSGKTFKGSITSIGSDLAISLDSSQRGLRPGRNTFALLVDGEKKLDGVATMIQISEEKFVMLDTGDGSNSGDDAPKGKKVPVETGLQNETEIIIKSGLAEGDRVVLPTKASATSQWSGGG